MTPSDQQSPIKLSAFWIIALDDLSAIAAKKEKIEKMIDFLKTTGVFDNADDTTKETVAALAKALTFLKKEDAKPDQDFFYALNPLLRNFPILFKGNISEGQKKEVKESLRKIPVMLDLYSNAINPTEQKTYGGKKLGDYLEELGFVSREQIEEAFKLQKSGDYPGKRLGDILIKMGLIDRAKLDKAIELQMVDGMEE